MHELFMRLKQEPQSKSRVSLMPLAVRVSVVDGVVSASSALVWQGTSAQPMIVVSVAAAQRGKQAAGSGGRPALTSIEQPPVGGGGVVPLSLVGGGGGWLPASGVMEPASIIVMPPPPPARSSPPAHPNRAARLVSAKIIPYLFISRVLQVRSTPPNRSVV